MPVLATFFVVRRGRDPFFKFFMKTLLVGQMKRYSEEFGIKFIGWYNVAYGWDFDNVLLLDLPDYTTLDRLERDEAARALGHRAGARNERETNRKQRARSSMDRASDFGLTGRMLYPPRGERACKTSRIRCSK
ncbi:MAG TPA: hypothetical protein VF361_02645, partial [Candidatus Limnocylindrales bacterium]